MAEKENSDMDRGKDKDKDKDLYLPGDFLSHLEEGQPGENTYKGDGKVFSAVVGHKKRERGIVDVESEKKDVKSEIKDEKGIKAREKRSNSPRMPYEGMSAYCLVTKAHGSKAYLTCMSEREVNGGRRDAEFRAVLPIRNIKDDFIEELDDEIRVGDIIKAKVTVVEREGIDVSIMPDNCGVVFASCRRCGSDMELKNNVFVCKECDFKDRRKTPRNEK